MVASTSPHLNSHSSPKSTSASGITRKRYRKNEELLSLVCSSTQTDLPISTCAVKPPQIPARSLTPTPIKIFNKKLPHSLVRSSSSSHVTITSAAWQDLTKSVEGLVLQTNRDIHNVGKSHSAPSSPADKANGCLNHTNVHVDGNGSGYEGHCRPHEQGDDDHLIDQNINYAESFSERDDEQKSFEENKNDADQQKGLPAACLFVASLSSSRTDDQLLESVRKHFERWGTLLHVKVLKDVMSRPYAFVQYEHPDDARNALAAAHNTTVDGRRIRVEKARVNRTLFIARFSRTSENFSVEAHERQLLDILGKYGPIEELTVLADECGRSRNSAYVKFAYRDDAIRVFIEIRRNYKWICEWCDTNLNLNSNLLEYPEASEYENQEISQNNSVLVGNLNPAKVTCQTLEQRFAEYGTISGLRLMDTAKNESASEKPAFAFVTYQDEGSAYNAVDYANGKTWLDKKLRVQLGAPEISRNGVTMEEQAYGMMPAAAPPPSGTPSIICTPVQPFPTIQYTTGAVPVESMMPFAPPTPLFATQSYSPPHLTFQPAFTPQAAMHRNSVRSNSSTDGPAKDTSSMGTIGTPLSNPNAAEFIPPVTPVTPPLSPVRMRVLSSDTGPLFVPAYEYDDSPMESSMMSIPNMVSNPLNFNASAHLQPIHSFAPPGLPPLQPSALFSPIANEISLNNIQPLPSLHQRQDSSGSVLMTPITPALFVPGGYENMPPSPITTSTFPYMYPFGFPHPSFTPPVGQQIPQHPQTIFTNDNRQRMRSGGYGKLRPPTKKANNSMGNSSSMGNEIKSTW